jgi:hypothetical protein
MSNPISKAKNHDSALVESPPTLEQLEQKIEVGLRILRQTFFEVGLALSQVKKRELYLNKGYSNYVAYCIGEWKLNKTYAYDLLKAADVVMNLVPQIKTNPQSFSAIAENLSTPLPQNESQCRELAKLKTPELQKRVWNEVIDSNSQDKITAITIRKAIAKRQINSENKVVATIPPLNATIRIVGNNPDLTHLHNCWGIVIAKHEYSVDIATCLGDAMGVHPQYLMALKEANLRQAAAVIERARAISESDCINFTVRNLLKEIATQPVPQLNQWQEIYLKITEETIKFSI